jgi:hypothetical protein
MPNIPKDPEDPVGDLLAMCAVWGTMWETWPKEEQQHYIASFKHSPNYKDAKARIAAYIDGIELRTLKRIEDMGHAEAKRQGVYAAHNMDGYHRAYGEAVSHNVHNRIAELEARDSKGE